MKTIYLIRHGESEGNASNKTHGSNSPLSSKGMNQATYIAKRMAKIPLTHIISSTYPRAKETSEIIHKEHTNIKNIIFSDYLVEYDCPSEMIGLYSGSDEMLRIRSEINENFHVPTYKHSDEETFEELKIRAKNTCQFIADNAGEHTVVVSHGIFARILMSYLLFKDSLSAHECLAFIKGFLSENTGLTILKYDENKTCDNWKIFTWNDHAHLADPDDEKVHSKQ